MWRWNLCLARFSLPKLRNGLGGFFVFPVVYSKDDNEVYTVQKVLRRSGAGLPLLISFSILRKVHTKLKNLLRTGRLLQEKWKDIIID